MAEEPTNSEKEIDQYITLWQRRYPEFQKSHQAELREFRSDSVSRFLHEHLLFRQKSTYAALLETMLTAQERDLLHTDPDFTRAWKIFVDLCWLKKRAKQAAIVLAIIVGCFALIIFSYLIFPKLFGPK